MIHIKKFIDKVSIVESKQNKDLIMTITDARGRRDELAKILADLYSVPKTEDPVIKVEFKGGTFR